MGVAEDFFRGPINEQQGALIVNGDDCVRGSFGDDPGNWCEDR
jgi:hypothetical protein